jgi:RimJ/RimL family protein N-acetyltransferase
MAVLDLSKNAIKTARLVLRPLRADDDARLFELFANWEVMRFLSSPPWPYTREDARAFVRLRMAEVSDTIERAITLRGEFIGLIGAIIKPASAVQRERGYNVGYWLGQLYWGECYMSEAARGFIAHVFATIPDDTLYSGAFTENAPSLRIQEKLGFQRDGDAMLFSNPHGKELPHVSTVLSRATFERLPAR